MQNKDRLIDEKEKEIQDNHEQMQLKEKEIQDKHHEQMQLKENEILHLKELLARVCSPLPPGRVSERLWY